MIKLRKAIKVILVLSWKSNNELEKYLGRLFLPYIQYCH